MDECSASCALAELAKLCSHLVLQAKIDHIFKLLETDGSGSISAKKRLKSVTLFHKSGTLDDAAREADVNGIIAVFWLIAV